METFNAANKAITDDIKKELRLQGHYLTGELEESISEIIIQEGKSFSLSATAADYIKTLEKFTPADNINISNAEFLKLKKWVLLRGLASFDHEATGVAAAIVSKWKKVGRPTEESRGFSQTGERTQAIAITFQRNQDRYGKIIDDVVIEALDDEFSKVKAGII